MEKGTITKELIAEIMGDLFLSPAKVGRRVKMYVSFDDKKSAEKWFKETWNPMVKEAMLKEASKITKKNGKQRRTNRKGKRT